jgi:hypothetical protein
MSFNFRVSENTRNLKLYNCGSGDPQHPRPSVHNRDHTVHHKRNTIMFFSKTKKPRDPLRPSTTDEATNETQRSQGRPALWSRSLLWPFGLAGGHGCGRRVLLVVYIVIVWCSLSSPRYLDRGPMDLVVVRSRLGRNVVEARTIPTAMCSLYLRVDSWKLT